MQFLKVAISTGVEQYIGKPHLLGTFAVVSPLSHTHTHTHTHTYTHTQTQDGKTPLSHLRYRPSLSNDGWIALLKKHGATA